MSNLSALTPAALLGVAAFTALHGAADLLRAKQNWQRTPDRWRDPAPLLFRALLPLARLFAEPITKLPNGLAAPLQRSLDRAGIGYAILPKELLILRGLSAALGVVAAVFVTPFLSLPGGSRGIALAAGAALGYAYPMLWLRDHGRRRLRRIEREFPALLELLALSVRAGLSFSAALDQCIGQLPASALGDEFRRAGRDIRTGTPRHEALERLAGRLDMPAITAFVSAVIQADETGAAISQTLNDQAEQRRRERFARAEKKANEAPVKMLLPLVALLFPLTFLIIAFPIVLEFLHGGIL